MNDVETYGSSIVHRSFRPPTRRTEEDVALTFAGGKQRRDAGLEKAGFRRDSAGPVRSASPPAHRETRSTASSFRTPEALEALECDGRYCRTFDLLLERRFTIAALTFRRRLRVVALLSSASLWPETLAARRPHRAVSLRRNWPRRVVTQRSGSGGWGDDEGLVILLETSIPRLAPPADIAGGTYSDPGGRTASPVPPSPPNHAPISRR